MQMSPYLHTDINPKFIKLLFWLFKNAMGITWNKKIYIRSSYTPPTHLIYHEEFHAKRQSTIGFFWWLLAYCFIPKFRFYEELDAYVISISNGADIDTVVECISRDYFLNYFINLDKDEILQMLRDGVIHGVRYTTS